VSKGILVVGTALDRVEAHILAGVKGAGFDIKVRVAPSSPHLDRIRDAGIDFEALACRSRFDLSAIRALRDELSSGRFGIMHSLSNRAISNGSIAALGFSVKQVAYRGTIGHVSRWDPLSWLTYLNPRLDRIVCVSEAVRTYLRQMVPSDKLATIHKGHDPAWYPRAHTRTLAEYGIPDDAFVISCVANMRPVKGVPFLLEAFDMLPAEMNAHLLLIGTIDSSAARALAQGRRHPERVHAIGFHPTPSELVSQSNCFVMPSIEREGLPKSLLEAMSVGVPCIATDVGGMPEVIQDGENGLIVAPKSAEPISMAIQRLAADRALGQRLAAAALETMKGRLSITHAIRKTVELYRELLAW
jgi:glycosyltransferase involved in cell wall biosynthesis